MPTGGDAAIGYASRLDEIGFPEFTTKLVSDTFDALVASDLRQQQAFVELLKQTGKTLSEYINDTKDDIGPAEVLPFLAKVLPPTNPTGDSPPSRLTSGSTLSAGDATALNNALEVTDAGIDSDNKVAQAGQVTPDKYQAIINAVAQRIAANKYTLLTDMVKLGVLRLVVDNGTIETRLNFRTYGSDYFRTNSASMSSSRFNFNAQAKTGGLLSAWVSAAASTSYTSVRVSTTSSQAGSNSAVNVDIFGGVKINFHTDYLPLNPNA